MASRRSIEANAAPLHAALTPALVSNSNPADQPKSSGLPKRASAHGLAYRPATAEPNTRGMSLNVPFVRRERRRSSVGAIPTRQRSLQPVAIGSDGGGND